MLYEVCRLILVFVFTLLYRMRSFHDHRVPARGPLLLVANHQSYLDPPLIGGPISHRRLTFLARAGLFTSRWFGGGIRMVGAVPIKEEASDTGAIKEILRRLAAGQAVLIFPEGSRCADGRVEPFKRGVALLIRRAGCPVVPVAIEGCFDTWPRFRRLPRVGRCRIAVSYGEPIAAEALMRDGPDAALLQLAHRIDSMRLELRRRLRTASRGRFPPPGPGDNPTDC